MQNPLLLLSFLILLSCETPPQNAVLQHTKTVRTDTMQKALPAMNTDTTKIVFQTIPLEPLKTGIAELKKRLEAGKQVKIVCYGNSITNGAVAIAKSADKVPNPYPEVLKTLLLALYPKARLDIVNEGHNGWRAYQGYAEADDLVIAHKPDWVILEFGINDVYSGFSPTLYTAHMKQLVQLLMRHKINVLILTATPIATAYHKKVLAYHTPLRALAESQDCAFLDLATAIANRAQQENVSAKTLLPDNIHFADEKYAWISEAIIDFIK